MQPIQPNETPDPVPPTETPRTAKTSVVLLPNAQFDLLVTDEVNVAAVTGVTSAIFYSISTVALVLKTLIAAADAAPGASTFLACCAFMSALVGGVSFVFYVTADTTAVDPEIARRAAMRTKATLAPIIDAAGDARWMFSLEQAVDRRTGRTSGDPKEPRGGLRLYVVADAAGRNAIYCQAQIDCIYTGLGGGLLEVVFNDVVYASRNDVAWSEPFDLSVRRTALRLADLERFMSPQSQRLFDVQRMVQRATAAAAPAPPS